MNERERKLFLDAQMYFDTTLMYQKLYQKKPKEFSDLVCLRKKDLLEDQREIPPFGSNLRVPQNQLARIHRTSGTSDKPLILALTTNDVRNVIKAGRNAFENVGVTSDDIVINCMNYCMWMGGFMDHQSLEATGAAVIPYGVGHTDNLIELIRSISGVCLHATPSYLGRIEQVAREKFGLRPEDLHIKKALLGGEGGVSDSDYRKKIETKFGMEAFDANYGMSEVMSIIASEDLNKNGLIFTAGEMLYPELLLKENNTVSNRNIYKGAVGELVLSNEVKEAQPLLRYATGDMIEVLEVLNEDPVSKFRFKVLGRSDDMLVVKGVNFYPAALRGLISKHKMFTGNFQVRVRNEIMIDYVKLVVEMSGPASDEEMKQYRQVLCNEIRSKYFVLCDVEFTQKLETNSNKIKLIERVDKF